MTPSCQLKSFLAQARSRFLEDLNDHTLADCALAKVGLGHT